ncbi:MAG: DUF4337 family protein [Polyangiaceae bacterium]|jgi:hypothetical protein
MPEEEIETQDLKERLDEAAEHAEEHRRAPWLMWLSLSTAVLAVLAAIASLESGSHSNDAILRKDDAILHQSKADDAWGEYQAKSIQATLYTMHADLAATADLAAKLRSDAEREGQERREIRRAAEEEQKAVEQFDLASERSLHRHHEFAKSVTIFQVAIALSAIAALTGRKATWWLSLGLGAVGVAFFWSGLLPH